MDNNTAASASGRRDAWCYGAPGISRALILAGSALADPQLTAAGALALTALSDRPSASWDVEGPTLCHGYAGVLQSATTHPSGAENSASNAVITAFDPQLPFAFRHLDNTVSSDHPGLLTGSAGVALALADHGQLPVPSTPARWDCLLLLS